MIKPSVKKKHHDVSPLETVTANMINLYLQAKMFHLNVTGPEFYGAHKTFDGIANLCVEWFDTLAERMRALEMTVCVHPQWLCDMSLMSGEEGVEHADCEEMLVTMLDSMKAVSLFINANMNTFDNTTANMMQEVDADLGKQMYFVRSSIS